MLHSSELCCTLRSYAAPFRATLHTTELGLTLNELHGTLKINGPRSTHRSFADPSDEIYDVLYRENPAKFPETNASLQARTRAARGIISFHCTTETSIENPPRKITVWAPVYVLTFCFVFFFFINIMSPAPPIAAALVLTALLLIEKTPQKSQFGKKICQSKLLLL